MTLPTESITIDKDTATLSDLLNHDELGSIPICPYCGNLARDHQTDENLAEHEHKPHEMITEVCRRLYECTRYGEMFYVYSDLNDQTHWVTAKIKEVGVEEPDDTDSLVLSPRKKLSEIVKPKWRFKQSLATKEDYTSTIARSLNIGLEMELDFKPDSNVTASNLKRWFGVGPTEYHTLPPCPDCGSNSCWKHLPDNLIRALERDSSIAGEEFIIYGSLIDSEEFARRLPIEKMKEHFVATERDSLHIHALLLHDFKAIPNVVAKNLWQLYRFYYPSIVFIFGNHSPKQGLLRNSHYANFGFFGKSPFLKRWGVNFNAHNNDGARAGLFFGETPVQNDMMQSFDVEIRTPDATLDLEQIIAAKAVTKAFILRAAQLSNYGLISVETDKDQWDTIKSVVNKLNSKTEVSSRDMDFMKSHSIRLLRELSPFLSEFERRCIKSVIEYPVRDRNPLIDSHKILMPPLSDTAKQLKKLVTIGSVEANSQDEWLTKVASLMNTQRGIIAEALAEIKGYWNEDNKSMMCNS